MLTVCGHIYRDCFGGTVSLQASDKTGVSVSQFNNNITSLASVNDEDTSI